jgi:hypothetical protein
MERLRHLVAAALLFGAAAITPQPSADLDCFSILQDGPTSPG